MNWLESKSNWLVVLVIVAIAGTHYFLAELESPSRDELRYVDYAHNLVEHQVFGLSCGALDQIPTPGNANVPLYPFFLAGVAQIDSSLSEQFYCSLAAEGQRGDCLIGTGNEPDEHKPRSDECGEEDYQSILAAQHLLLVVSLLLVFLISKNVFADAKLHWLTLLAAVLSGVLTKYVDRVLTENLLLVLFLGLQYTLLCYWKKPGWLLVTVASALLVLLTLTRPEYFYLAIAWAFFLFVFGAWKKEGTYLAYGLIALLVISLGMAPWLVRNVKQLDSYAVSAGNYGEITLSYRTAYNVMGVTEWIGSFVYFLPDFGDSLAKRVLPMSWYWREFDERPGSYQDITNQKLEAAVLHGRTLNTILKEDVFSQPIKHALVTLPLSWRGVFIAKYFGLIGFFAYVFLLYREWKAKRWELALISLPIWFIVFFHGAISINIPRYNLPLVSLYALSWAWMLDNLYRKIRLRFKSQSASLT